MFSSSEDAVDITPPKSSRTRALLRQVALESFLERGYDATTMRLIAEQAEVSVGDAYYHFETKNDLLRELYRAVRDAHRSAAMAELEGTPDLVDRIAVVYRAGLDQITPYHAHAAEFLSAAMAPGSGVNPLTPEAADARADTEALFVEAVRGARRGGLPREMADALPSVLFLGHLLLTQFWTYDRSPGQARTQRLLAGGIRLLRTALPLAKMPLLRGMVRDMLGLVTDLGR